MIHVGYYTPLVGFASSAREPPPALAGFPLMKEFQSSGQFWLPNLPEQPLRGKVRYVPGGPTNLTLEGNVAATRGGRDLAIPEIHGRLFNGAPCVLKDARGHVESFIARDETFRTILHSRLFLFGLDPATSAADRFAVSAVQFSHLNDWFDRPLLVDYENRSFDKCLVKFEPDSNEAQTEFEGIPFKLTVSCARTIPTVAGSSGVEFTFGYKLMIIPDEPQLLAWHMRVVATLREFFMFLVGTGIYTLEVQAFPGTTPQEGEVHVFPRIAVPMLVRLDPVYFYSQHRQLKQLFPTLLANWFREQERLAVVRHTLSDLLTVDGISPEAVFGRVVQTMEHFHGLVSLDEGYYVPRLVWRRFTRWLEKQFPDIWNEGGPSERSALLRSKAVLIDRIRSVNSLSFRTRIRALFDAVPTRELMPLLDNPSDATEYLDSFLPRIEATRHYLTHFSAEQQDLAFDTHELEVPTLQCWSVLIFTLAKFLGLSDQLAGDLALAARNTMFLVGTNTQL